MAAHGRRGRDRRRGLREDRRPQEGADHQRRRQEHVAGEHRVAAEDMPSADRHRRRDRRPAALQRRADRARSGCLRRLREGARHRGRLPAGAGAGRRVQAAIEAAIEEANTHLSRVEQIKKWCLLETEWQPGGEELTPTMKLKRRPIERSTPRRSRCLFAQLTSLLSLALARDRAWAWLASPQPLPGRGGSGSNQIGLDTTSITSRAEAGAGSGRARRCGRTARGVARDRLGCTGTRPVTRSAPAGRASTRRARSAPAP